MPDTTPAKVGVLVWNQYTEWPTMRDVGVRAAPAGGLALAYEEMGQERPRQAPAEIVEHDRRDSTDARGDRRQRGRAGFDQGHRGALLEGEDDGAEVIAELEHAFIDG